MGKIELTIFQKWLSRRLREYAKPISDEVIKQAFPNYHLAKNPPKGRKKVKDDSGLNT